MLDGAFLEIWGSASGTISDNDIYATNSSYGIYCASNGGSWTVSGGTVQGASSNGVRATSSGTLNLSGVVLIGSAKGLYVSGPTNARADTCAFIGQSIYGVQNAGTGSVDARWCYWGSWDGPSGAGSGSGSRGFNRRAVRSVASLRYPGSRHILRQSRRSLRRQCRPGEHSDGELHA